MSGVALFEMASQYRQLLNTLSDGDFDLTTIQDTIEASGLVDDISSKAVGVEMVARTIEVHVPAIEAEIERLTALKKQRQNAAKGLRDYLKANMIATGITKIEAPLFKISLRKSAKRGCVRTRLDPGQPHDATSYPAACAEQGFDRCRH